MNCLLCWLGLHAWVDREPPRFAIRLRICPRCGFYREDYPNGYSVQKYDGWHPAQALDRAEEAIRQRDEALAQEAAMREAMKPFAKGVVDVSGSAVIIGYPEASIAVTAAQVALSQPTPETKAEGQGGGA